MGIPPFPTLYFYVAKLDGEFHDERAAGNPACVG